MHSSVGGSSEEYKYVHPYDDNLHGITCTEWVQ